MSDLTAAEALDALCEAQSVVTAGVLSGNLEDGEVDRRDRIKAAVVEWIEPWRCADAKCNCTSCHEWRKLEEACRGR